MRIFTVSRDDSIYEAWPDVALCPNGRLVCVFTECNHHSDRNNSRLAVVKSDDRGRTWSKKQYITEKSNGKYAYNCARISTHSDGRLVMVCDYNDRSAASRFERHAASENHLFISSDNGDTWEGPVMTPIIGVVPDRVIELRSGRWLLAVHRQNEKNGKLTEFVRYSDDKGKTWSDEIVVASDERYNLCEASLCEVESNVIVAMLRENSGIGLDGMKAISKDGGAHWDGVYNVPLPALHRPTAGLLKDGNMLVTYRFMQGGKGWLGSWTQNTFGAILNKDGLTSVSRNAQSARIFPIDYDRSTVSDGGYTGWVQFPDGEIYIVNYIVDDAPKAQIRGYSVMPGELIIETLSE